MCFIRAKIIVLVSIFIASTLQIPANAITFGEEVLSGGTDYAYVVSIWYTTSPEKTPEFICTGTLIEPTVILTAAHCVKDTGAYFVKYGNNLLKEGSLREVTATWKSPQYSQSQSVGDVGLMRLSYPAQGIQTIPLASSISIRKILANKKTRLEALGWGIDQNGNNATYLRKVSAKDESSAMKRILKNRWRSDVWLGAGKYDSKQKIYAGVCSGDSGGPLFAVNGSQRIQVGVTSFGFSEDCEIIAPSVFMRLSHYVGHIQQNLRTLENNQIVQNRAFPSLIEEPKISGTPAAGSTITCEKGRWSDNTTNVTVTWSEYGRTYNSSTLILSETYSSRTFQCTVVGKNSNGEVKRVLTIIQPPTPVKPSTPYPSISGISSYSNTTVGTVAQCSASTYSTDVTMSYQWGYGTSWSVSALTNPIGSGSTLTITQSILDAIKGKYLICQATATNSAGSATGFTTQSVTGATPTPTPTPTPTSTIRPSAPVNFRGIIGANSVSLSWTAPANNGVAIVDYVIERSTSTSDWIVLNDGVSTQVTYTDSGLTPGVRYDYRARAFNGTSYSDYSWTISAGIPQTPTPTPTPTPTRALLPNPDLTNNNVEARYYSSTLTPQTIFGTVTSSSSLGISPCSSPCSGLSKGASVTLSRRIQMATNPTSVAFLINNASRAATDRIIANLTSGTYLDGIWTVVWTVSETITDNPWSASTEVQWSGQTASSGR